MKVRVNNMLHFIKKRNIIKKMTICALALSLLTSVFALQYLKVVVNADVTYKKEYNGVQSQPITLSDGTYLFDNVTISGNSSQPSAVIIQGKVTIVLKGVNNISGYDARWIGEAQLASGAGIQVEKIGTYSNELTIQGDKDATLNVKGGNANKGEDGFNGGDGHSNKSPSAGRGGKGGNGASAAIGGRGGTNGSGTVAKGKDCGKVTLLGGFNLNTEAGAGGRGGKGGNGGRSDGDYYFIYINLSSGAGGGGGGGGGFPAVAIGGGGGAGDNGGRGADGEGVRTTSLAAFPKAGGAGGGGGRGWGAGGGGGSGFFAYYIGQPKYSSIRPKGGQGGLDPKHYGQGGQTGIMEATLAGSGHDAGGYILKVSSYSGDIVSVDDAEARRNGGFIYTTRNASSEPQQRRNGYDFCGRSASNVNEYSMWGGYGTDCAWAFRLQGGGETPEAKTGSGMGRRYELWIRDGGSSDEGRAINSGGGAGAITIDKSENITWPEEGDTGNGGGPDQDPGDDKTPIRTIIDLSHKDTKITFNPAVGKYTGKPVDPQISIVSSTGINVDPKAYDIATVGDLYGPGTVTYRFIGKGQDYEPQWVENETTREYTIEKGDLTAYLEETEGFYTRTIYNTFKVKVVGLQTDGGQVKWDVKADPSTPDVQFTVTESTADTITVESTKNIGIINVNATVTEGSRYKEFICEPVQLNVIAAGANLFSISKIDDQEYTGSEIKPPFKVTFDGKELKEGIDYTFKYENNIEVGRAKIVITGIGEYTGNFNNYFNIIPADISEIKFNNANYSTTPGSLKNLYYTSYSQTSPPLDGWLKGKQMVEGKDYTLSYSNLTEVGPVVVSVVGIGNYTKSTTLQYEILPTSIEDISGIVVNAPANVVYNGKPQQSKPTVMLNGRILKENIDYTLTYENNIKAGIATVVIHGKGNFTTDSTRTTQFEILKRPIYVVPEKDQIKFSGDNEPLYKYHLDNVVEGDKVTLKEDGKMIRESGEGVGEYAFRIGDLGLDYGKYDNDNYLLYMTPDTVTFKVQAYDTDEVAIIRGEIINKQTGERALVNEKTGWYNNIVEVVAPKGYLISRNCELDPEGTSAENSFWQPYFSSEDGDFSKDGEGMTYYLMKIPEKAGDKALISQAKQVKYKQDTIAPSNRIEMNQKKIYTELKKDLSFKTYFQNDVILDIIASDETSGVASNDYFLADKEYTKKELDSVNSWVSKSEAEYQLKLDTEMKKIMYLRTIDVAGNVTYSNTDGFIIDKTAPYITITYPNENKWVTGKDGVVEINVKEELSGVDERYVDYHLEYVDGKVSDPYIIKLDKDGNAIVKDLVDGDYEFIVTAVDNAGNAHSEQVHIKIDTIAPTLELKGDITKYEQSKDIEILANVGPSGVDKVYAQRQDYGNPCENNGTWIDITDEYNNNNHKYNVDENGTYYIKYINGAQVESNIASISFDTIDKTKPTVNVRAITVSDNNAYTSNTWTRDNVKVFFENSADNKGNTKYSYRIKKTSDSDFSDWQSTTRKNDYEASILLSQTGSYDIEMKIVSEAGMESSITAFVVKIDKQLPTGKITLVDKSWEDFISKPEFKDYYNSDQLFVVTPSDALSGIGKVDYILLEDTDESYTPDTIEEYVATNGGWKNGNIEIDNKVNVPIVGDKAYTIFVKITDKVGNVRYLGSDGAIIDKTKPILTIDKSEMIDYDYPISATKWITNPFAVLPTTLSDTLSGQDILKIKYTLNGENMEEQYDISSGNYDITSLPDGQYDLVVEGYDKAKNVANETIVINKDTVLPTANLKGDTINLGSTKKVTMDPKVGVSGLKEVSYQFVKAGDSFDKEKSWTTITNTYMDGLKVTQKGTIYVKVVNNLGIESIETIEFGNIEKAPVKIVVDTVDEDGILVNATDDWYPAINVRFYNNPKNVSGFEYEYHTGDNVWEKVAANEDGYAFIKAPEGETTYTLRITNTDTKEEDITTIKVKVDTTKPTGELSTTAQNTRTWTDANRTISIEYGLHEAQNVILRNVKDAINSSGLKSVEYYVATAGKDKQLTKFANDLTSIKQLSNAQWETLPAQQLTALKENKDVVLASLKVDHEYVIYVKIKDVAGNVHYISSDGITIDASEPVIETDYKAGTWIISDDTFINAVVKDNLSGVKEGSYDIVQNTKQHTYTFNADARDGKFVIDAKQFHEGSNQLTIKASDVAGNVAQDYLVEVRKDTVKPEIHVNQGNSTSHQVGIIVDKIGASDIKEVHVSSDNGLFNKEDITSHYGEGIQVTRNGTYTFVLVNNAGVASDPVHITIDDLQAPPTVKVEGFDAFDDEYVSGTWSRSEIALKVSVEETQIGKSTYEYSLDNKTWKVMDPDANDEYWITHRDNGEYTYYFRVTAADGARSDVVSFDVKLDTTIPEFTYEITPKENTNRWVDVEIHPLNDATTLSYSFDGGETFSKSKTQRFISNGYVDLVVKNETGTTAEKTAQIDTIDRLSPLMIVYENQINDDNKYRVELEVNDAPKNLDFIETGVHQVFITSENPYSEVSVRTKPLEKDYVLEKAGNQHYVTKGEFKAEVNGNSNDNYWIIATDNVGNYKIKSFRVDPDSGKVEEKPDPENPEQPGKPNKPGDTNKPTTPNHPNQPGDGSNDVIGDAMKDVEDIEKEITNSKGENTTELLIRRQAKLDELIEQLLRNLPSDTKQQKEVLQKMLELDLTNQQRKTIKDRLAAIKDDSLVVYIWIPFVILFVLVSAIYVYKKRRLEKQYEDIE